MGFLDELASLSNSKLVLPCVGKMFNSDITDGDSALICVINKGYLESPSIEELLTFIEGTQDSFVFVGNIDKVQLNSGGIVYRQRVFMHSILNAMKSCASYGFQIFVPNDFRIPINSMMNNLSDCYYLERIARFYRQSIDSYLKKVVLIQLYYMAESVGVSNNISEYYEKTKKRGHLKGILDYAPMLCSSYSISDHTSSIFIDESRVGTDLFYTKALDYGYTSKHIAKLVEGGLLNANKKRG